VQKDHYKSAAINLTTNTLPWSIPLCMQQARGLSQAKAPATRIGPAVRAASLRVQDGKVHTAMGVAKSVAAVAVNAVNGILGFGRKPTGQAAAAAAAGGAAGTRKRSGGARVSADGWRWTNIHHPNQLQKVAALHDMHVGAICPVSVEPSCWMKLMVSLAVPGD
jgi:hypothetical protein